MADPDPKWHQALPVGSDKGEPALIIAAVQAVFVVAATFLHLDATAIAAINAAIIAVGAVVIRQSVTPV